MNAGRIVLGTAGLGGVWGKIDAGASVRAILLALENGITAMDTAPAYGDAETLLGRALRQWRGAAPLISTKVGRLRSYAADEAQYDYNAAAMLNSLHNSLKTLGVEALDTVFLHDPEAMPPASAEGAITVLQRLKRQGLTRRIGLGGNIPAWLESYIAAGIFDVIMEFNRLNACRAPALKDRLPQCRQRGMDYFAASPLNMGLLGSNYTAWQQQPPAWMDARTLATARALQSIAAAQAMPLSALAHRFLLSVPHDFRIVIGASNSEELSGTMAELGQGPLPETVYRNILDCQHAKLM
ncbi:aldo/keto reductase [Chitinophaga vietnamensis]|uniref:aldo/keto reductase n=1 Tax=Chitinophaga vietnamensis TaxID=2593957 RepID=UPI00137564EC|nr:aldo/keto reductase [Chitinophaga vietnamensis]